MTVNNRFIRYEKYRCFTKRNGFEAKGRLSIMDDVRNGEKKQTYFRIIDLRVGPVKKWIEQGKGRSAIFLFLKFPHFEGYREEDPPC